MMTGALLLPLERYLVDDTSVESIPATVGLEFNREPHRYVPEDRDRYLGGCIRLSCS